MKITINTSTNNNKYLLNNRSICWIFKYGKYTIYLLTNTCVFIARSQMTGRLGPQCQLVPLYIINSIKRDANTLLFSAPNPLIQDIFKNSQLKVETRDINIYLIYIYYYILNIDYYIIY